MQSNFQNCASMRNLTMSEINQVGGGATFGEWVGRAVVWANPVRGAVDHLMGGHLADASANVMGAIEDWVNEK